MRVFVNSKEVQVETGITLIELIHELGLEPKPVGFAVAVNEEVVPKSKYGECRLKDGDRVEIVNIVGGG